ncbi:coenzyme F420-0:L-glutamate ligase [Rarobacter incanus]|uniref:Coenzyme F420-0:L-glutamate ligase/coenzyme F420-1:gamma-L-glutamate ligase n=1 Tax=Rarobacter incanus TaxID=153494 RepID=A0A542SQZ6_9MICO|nr:coenzyme F420-0:L-glutamate ligase [Rarobacter incanus]TQK77032.1 coenzyme F420-0:L-glutamate ligase/coenzyme F420-1:gamma-L-glutamate ligase [Rarobacter incanus]
MLSIWPITGIGEVARGADLGELIAAAVAGAGGRDAGPATAGTRQLPGREHPIAVAQDAAADSPPGGWMLRDGDVVVIASKVVSKAEGRVVAAVDREQAITDETVRVVATRAHGAGLTRIVENRLGLVMAAAGVDASNTPAGTVLLLPVDPDASARGIRARLRELTGARVGVIIADTSGRAWRQGVTDMAIGAAGVTVLDDLRGGVDREGRVLSATVVAVADELAGASELVRGKACGVPVAVIRGAASWTTHHDGGGARAIVRPAADDMFRLGSDEAYRRGYEAGRAAAERDPVAGQ